MIGVITSCGRATGYENGTRTTYIMTKHLGQGSVALREALMESRFWHWACARKRGRVGLSLIVLSATACFMLSSVGAPAGNKRVLAGCTAYAFTPVVYAGPRTGFGAGGTYTSCNNNSWSYNVRFVNNAGNILDQESGTAPYALYQPETDVVSCAGAIVHSFMYINDAGVGTSHTSGTNSDCAY